MYRFVATDLDGTMLNSFGEVTENTKRVIKETMQKGTDVVITSGRSIDSIKNIAEEINSSKYIIACNGAAIYDREKDKIIYEKSIPKEKTIEIIRICEQNSIYYNIYTNKSIVTDSLRYNALYYYKENLKREENKKTNITLVDNVEEYIRQMKNENVMKIFIADSSQVVFKSIIKRLKNIKNVDVLELSHMSRKIIQKGTIKVPIEYYYTEISMNDVDKWYAVEYLINEMKIKKDEVIAIGDNWNDKKMIEQAGLGITLKKSNPEIIEVADYVTDDNNHEGVAKALEKFCATET